MGKGKWMGTKNWKQNGILCHQSTNYKLHCFLGKKKQFRIRKNHREVLENRSFVIYVKSWFLKSQLLDKHMVFWRCSISSSNGHHENGARNIRGERWKHIHHSCPPCTQGTTELFFSRKSGHLYGFDSRRKKCQKSKTS